MKKRPITLIEVVIALGIASLLLAVMFPYLRDTVHYKKKLEIEKAFVFSKAHVQQRLATLFSKMKPSGSFKTVQEKDKPFELQFDFNNGYDFKENFRDLVTGHLYFEKGKLLLKIEGRDKMFREEVLIEGLKKIDFEFTHAVKGKFKVVSKWEENGHPLFFALKVIFPDDKEDAFYFRLCSYNRLEYP